MNALQPFEVEQFIYASTMLVHAACQPGERINEQQPIDPHWAHPISKAAAKAVIQQESGQMPALVLRLAGVYDERFMAPTAAQQAGSTSQRAGRSRACWVVASTYYGIWR